MLASLFLTVGLRPLTGPHRPAAPRVRATTSAKITGAALAAAFAAKSSEAPAKELTLAEKEERVIEAIRAGLDAGVGQPRRAWAALGGFGRASGDLATSWLTPQQLESCLSFWGGGSTLVARDLRRGRLSLDDLRAAPWFALLSLNTFPWTPLLAPLVGRALNNGTDSSTSAFLPRSFSAGRLAALRRLRRDTGLSEQSRDARTPQNLDEGVAFFSDGFRMLARDARRGRLLAYGDGLGSFGWFMLLSLSTFPLTPLLLPLIDKRRDGAQSDYVPAAFRARRLAAFARHRAAREGAAELRAPAATIRAIVTAAPGARPPPGQLLAAIVALPGAPEGRAAFLEHLAGGGSPGRRWRLVYVADKGAVRAARQQRNAPSAGGVGGGGGSGGDGLGGVRPPSWLRGAGAALRPWPGGSFVDGYASAVQRFDLERRENENGVFALLGADWLRFAVRGPFAWPEPERRAVCAFRPTHARLQLGAREWEWPLEAEGAAALPFEQTPVTKLPFFKFLLVDDRVAVAQGRSGGVAVWARVADDDPPAAASS